MGLDRGGRSGLVFCGLVLLGAAAQAQDPPTASFDAIGDVLAASLDFWKTTLLPYAQRLFVLLATFELLWTLYDGFFRRDLGVEAGAILFFKRLFVLLILFNLLTLAPGIGADLGAEFILEGFKVVGRDASGLSSLAPAAFLLDYFQFMLFYTAQVALFIGLVPGTGIVLVQLLTLMTFVLFGSGVWIALTYAIVVGESIFLVGAGFFLLAFSGSRFTVGFAERFPTMLIRVGLKFLVLYMLLGVGIQLIEIWRDILANPLNWGFLTFTMVPASVFVFAFFVWRIPRFIADLTPSQDVFNLRLLFQD